MSKCYHCQKKINSVELIFCKCKCNNHYCSLHRLAEDHNCQYKFKSEINKEDFILKNKCTNLKINAI